MMIRFRKFVPVVCYSHSVTKLPGYEKVSFTSIATASQAKQRSSCLKDMLTPMIVHGLITRHYNENGKLDKLRLARLGHVDPNVLVT
jgi:hypothetical protein